MCNPSMIVLCVVGPIALYIGISLAAHTVKQNSEQDARKFEQELRKEALLDKIRRGA